MRYIWKLNTNLLAEYIVFIYEDKPYKVRENKNYSRAWWNQQSKTHLIILLFVHYNQRPFSCVGTPFNPSHHFWILPDYIADFCIWLLIITLLVLTVSKVGTQYKGYTHHAMSKQCKEGILGLLVGSALTNLNLFASQKYLVEINCQKENKKQELVSSNDSFHARVRLRCSNLNSKFNGLLESWCRLELCIG